MAEANDFVGLLDVKVLTAWFPWKESMDSIRKKEEKYDKQKHALRGMEDLVKKSPIPVPDTTPMTTFLLRQFPLFHHYWEDVGRRIAAWMFHGPESRTTLTTYDVKGAGLCIQHSGRYCIEHPGASASTVIEALSYVIPKELPPLVTITEFNTIVQILFVQFHLLEHCYVTLHGRGPEHKKIIKGSAIGRLICMLHPTFLRYNDYRDDNPLECDLLFRSTRAYALWQRPYVNRRTKQGAEWDHFFHKYNRKVSFTIPTAVIEMAKFMAMNLLFYTTAYIHPWSRHMAALSDELRCASAFKRYIHVYHEAVLGTLNKYRDLRRTRMCRFPRGNMLYITALLASIPSQLRRDVLSFILFFYHGTMDMITTGDFTFIPRAVWLPFLDILLHLYRNDDSFHMTNGTIDLCQHGDIHFDIRPMVILNNHRPKPAIICSMPHIAKLIRDATVCFPIRAKTKAAIACFHSDMLSIGHFAKYDARARIVNYQQLYSA
jgi:hypothetical protein